MTSADFRQWLEERFPGFTGSLADSVFVRADGSFTLHGLCSEFSSFYEHHVDIRSPEVAELFRLVETTVAADPNDSDEFANALCTCFLENISSTNAGEASLSLMGPASRAFFDAWHMPPNSASPGESQ
jgi:hypothetical protein